MNNEEKESKVKNYFVESYQELKKVTWPTKNKAVRLTLIVLGFCLVTAFVIGVLDFAFHQGYQQLVIQAAKITPATPVTIDPSSINVTPVTGEATPN